uniref:Cyclin-dependent kinase 20-like n=1 Tax=Geotrypetes seraphini TaxID=260995 RepID=A0A6P8RAP2_GEOSA|nr:cyclin-dependent kinase 20-like [Geotrypetes seraphini]
MLKTDCGRENTGPVQVTSGSSGSTLHSRAQQTVGKEGTNHDLLPTYHPPPPTYHRSCHNYLVDSWWPSGALWAGVFSNEGDRLYSHQVTTKCIFGELLNNSPLFPGENDIEQLCCVLRILVTPNEKIWSEITELPDYNKISFKENPPIPLEHIIPDASPPALDLLKRFLVYPSKQRIQATEALLHPYFFTEPLPAHHLELPIPQCSGKKTQQCLQHQNKYRIDQPLEESVVDSELITPYVMR